MKLSDVVREDLILPSMKGSDVSSILQEFAEAIAVSGIYPDWKPLHEKLLERESQESTGIGNGVAIPHCKLDKLQDVILAIGFSETGVEFRAIDGLPTFFFFLIVSPSNAAVQHLRALASLSRLLKSKTFLSRLKQRPGKSDLIQLIRQEEENAAVTT